MNRTALSTNDMPWRVWIAALSLLAVHATVGLWAASGKSVTYDEIFHVTGGFFYNRHGDFRLHAENGVLPQRWAALPATLTGRSTPPLTDNVYWSTSDVGVISYQLFYETGQDHWPMLMQARAMALVFTLGTGCLVFAWARALFGNAGGLLALSFHSLDPNFLAHGPLATSDSAITFCLLASVSAFWVFLRQPTVGRMALSTVALGLAAVAKFSAALLPIIFLILVGWHLIATGPSERRRWLRWLPLGVLFHVAGAAVIIWAFYGFRYTASAPGLPPADHFIYPWEYVLKGIGRHHAVVEFCRDAKLLPEAFLYGYSLVVKSVQARAAFLAGEYSSTGWPSFFPLAFLWKTPLALLGAAVLGLLVGIRRWRREPAIFRSDATAAAPLIALFAVYWGGAVNSELNIGHRHLLPVYPVLFIMAGAIAAPGALTGRGRILAPGVLLLCLASANVRVAPHYLAFFNTIAGGPANGWRLLADSSLDWGQDLPLLKRWVQANGASEPVYVSYFGSGEPAYYGIDARRIAFFNNFKFPTKYVKLEPGWYCVSATVLQQVYSPARGPWTLEREAEFQDLRSVEPALANPSLRESARPNVSAAQWQAAVARFDHLRMARLCHFLRARGPDDQVGHSILIFRLSAEEIAGATAGSLKDWQAVIERVASKP